MKEAKVVKLKEVIECDGNFFYIEKQRIKDTRGRNYSRYQLKFYLKDTQIEKLNRFLRKKRK